MLTYAGDGCFDPKVVRSDVGSFFKRFDRRSVGCRFRTRGRRSGTPAVTGYTFTSQSVAASRNASSETHGPGASCTSS